MKSLTEIWNAGGVPYNPDEEERDPQQCDCLDGPRLDDGSPLYVCPECDGMEATLVFR